MNYLQDSIWPTSSWPPKMAELPQICEFSFQAGNIGLVTPGGLVVLRSFAQMLECLDLGLEFFREDCMPVQVTSLLFRRVDPRERRRRGRERLSWIEPRGRAFVDSHLGYRCWRSDNW